MVQSGLNDTDIRVSHIRLAIHFICALFLLGYLLWFTLKVSVPARQLNTATNLKPLSLTLLCLLFFQLIYGAFMAGSHAALSAPTWPDINGSYIPSALFGEGSVLHDLCYNPITIQFVHRTLAYLIGATVLIWFYKAGKIQSSSWLYQYRWIPLLLVVAHITLGILALLNSMFKNIIYFSVVHQFVGILLLMSIILAVFLSSQRKSLLANHI